MSERTHWEGCWRERTHHECAVARCDELERERDALRAGLREAFCPRPGNDRPDDFTVGQCCDADECGCVIGAPLVDAARAKEPQR